MPQVNPSLPVPGQPNATEEPKIPTALGQIVGAVNNVDSSQIVDGTVTDADLVSPNNGVYRLLSQCSCVLSAGIAAGTYYPIANDSFGTSGVASNHSPSGVVHVNSADFTLAGKTPKLHVRFSAMTNGTAPGVTFTAGLYPVSSSGANVFTLTLGTVIASSTAAIASPAANSVVQAGSADFDIPANGVYALGFVVSGTTAANSWEALQAALYLRHV